MSATIHAVAGSGVTIAGVVAVARDGATIVLTDDAVERMARSRAVVDGLAASTSRQEAIR